MIRKLQCAVVLALTWALVVTANGGAAVTVSQQRLVASDPAPYANFGFDVDISGSTAIVGAIQANREAGAAYVFVRGASSWRQQAKLAPPDAYDSQYFGESVAVSGNTAAVGTISDGNVYVYLRTTGRWRLQQELHTPASGYLALSGSTLVTEGGYVYLRSGSIWTRAAHLVPDLGYTAAGPVGVSGSLAVLSTTQGPGVVFRHDAAGWTQEVRLGSPAGAGSPEVSVAGSSVVLCVKGFGGTAYQRHPGGGWDSQGTLTVPGLGAYNGVGASCAINGTTAVLGAPGRLGHSGGIEVFHRGSAGVWSFSSELHPASLRQNDGLGSSLALSGSITRTGSTILGGAPFLDGGAGSNIGAVFAFTH
ncbi:MAG TPA: FG-GAP repeat protein [Gaiellales bacterium]|nr:FG-GAP repeat protein [Gaiellales bacterium]